MYGHTAMRGLNKKIVLSAFLAVIAWAPAAHTQAPALEYQVKASYLYNFLQFITWPDDVFPEDGKFNLCVVGAERFGNALAALAGERGAGREIAVRPLARPAQARAQRCHLLFIAAGSAAADAAAETAGRGVLTVGETPGFLERGGIINLVESRGRIRFEINQSTAREAGLTLSSQLLRLALTAP